MSKNDHKKTELTASLLRLILSTSILLIILIGVGGFIYSKKILTNYAVDVSKQKVDATASNGNLQSLAKIRQELIINQDAIKKVDLLKSTNKFPEFQIVDDVTKHANDNGIKIVSFEYVTKKATTAPSTSSTTPTSPSSPQGQTATVKSNGLNGVSISVTIENPVKYRNLLQFMYDIEQNLPKMQISGVTLKKAENPSLVSVDPITIEMYTK